MKKRVSKKKATRRRPRHTPEQKRALLKQLERCVYDVQKWRIAAGHRAEIVEEEFSLTDKKFFSQVEEEMGEIEIKGTRRLATLLNGIPIWDEFLKPIRGIGPKMGALLVAETNIENCHTPSKLWAWWGVHVVKGHAAQKSEDCKFSPFRKAKVVKVLAELLIMHKSPGYYELYTSYKKRKEEQIVSCCMACKGTGKASKKDEETGQSTKVHCWNCDGSGGPAPWGVSPEHRHRAALRYMVKRLLLEMWRKWRELDGLDVPPSYAEVHQPETHPARGG